MTLMRPNFNEDALKRVSCLVGDAKTILHLCSTPVKVPFAEDILEFLNEVSRNLLRNPGSRAYSDVVTLAFWLRKASTLKLRERFVREDGNLRLGRGVAFHIAPSNVPVNFAYSLAAGLLTGNANVVRVPSRPFEQVMIIVDAIQKALDEMKEMSPYIVLVRYGRDAIVNDAFSSIADTRIIWGGDSTIAELRKSELPPRSTEVTFADRYSIAIIDADVYLEMEDKAKIAQDFYNDTYFTDQNACTSPRLVVWMGEKKERAKDLFWKELHNLVERKYTFQPIQGINKLTSSCLAAVSLPGARTESHADNLLVRVYVPVITESLMDLKDNSGYFFEYDCEDILEMRSLCDDKRCQTIALLGDRTMLYPLLRSAPGGIDRVVPLGKTMDFDLLWDGYDLSERLSRTIVLT